MSKEFVPGSPNEAADDAFRRLIFRDLLHRDLSDDELATLEGDRHLWLDELTFVAQDLQFQLTERKAAIGKQKGPAQREYVAWRSSAMVFQIRLLDRRRDVKAALKLENRENDLEHGNSGVMRQMLAELQAIHKLLANSEHV